jgi:hypothetical protein
VDRKKSSLWRTQNKQQQETAKRKTMKNLKTLAIAALLWATAGLQANATITINTQPADTTVGVNAALTMWVTATTDTTNAITYQWYKKVGTGAAATTGTNSKTNAVASASASDEASYYVVMTDVTSTNTSSTNKVLVVALPTISKDLTNKNLGVGSNFTMTVTCSNRLGDFRWFKNATNALSGSTSSYTITGAQASDAGSYTVVLSNIAGSVTSTPSVVAVYKFPAFTNQLFASNTVPQGVSITNTVAADGTAVSYFWKVGTKFLASTSNTLILSAVTTGSNGTYSVVASNAIGSVSSNVVTLTVIPPPTISTQPKAATLAAGQKLTLTVTAAGIKPYTNLVYRWVVNGTNTIYGSNNATATTSSLVVTNAGTNNSGSYTVVITNFGGSVTSSAAVVSVGNDTTAPTLKITDPAKTNAVATNTPYYMVGTATDNVAVTNVAWATDGINFTNAVGTTNNFAKWTNRVDLSIGSNTVWVRAVDYSGNAVTNKQQIFYAKWYSLTISNAGSGGGTLTGPSNAVQYGSNYTLTAKATAHNKFIRWVSWSGVTINSNVITKTATNLWPATSNAISFKVTTNATIAVEFDTNLFWNAAGTYNGLIVSTNLNASHTNVGFVTATVTTNLTYSGKIMLAGRTASVSGEFGTNGSTSLTMADGNLLALSLGAGQQITGTLKDATGTNLVANLTADAAFYGKTNPAASFAGNYTVVIPPATNSIGGATNGYGYATINVASNGTVTIAGATADGQAVTQSVPISDDGYVPMFVQMYVVGKTNATGEVAGWLRFATNGTPSGTLIWIKSQAISKLTNYANGLTNVATIRSSKFTAPTASDPQVLDGFILGTAAFTGGGMTNNVTDWVFMDTSGLIYCYDPNMTLKIAKTGLISGKFPYNNSATSKVSFSGVVLQNATNAFGAFSGGGVSGSMVITNYPLP